MVAGALMYLAAIISARLLGPDAFGQITFAMVLAQLLSIAAVRGLDFASGRAVVMTSDPGEVRHLIGTAYAVAAGGAVVGALVLLASSEGIAQALEWPRLSVVGAALLLLPVSLKALNERLLPAVNLTTTLAAVRPVEGVVLLSALGVLALTSSVTPTTVLAAMVGAACLVVASLFSFMARHHLVGSFRLWSHGRLTPYANVVLAITVAPLPLQFSDRFVIQAKLSDADLGLYVACAAATQLLAAQMVALVSGVLLPHVLREGPAAINRLRRTSRLLLLPATVVFLCALELSLLALGSSYRPTLLLVLMFSVLAAVQLANGLLHVTVLADPEALRLDVRLTLVRAVVYVAALVALAWSDRLSLAIVAATLLTSESIQAGILWRLSARVARTWSTTNATRHREA